jgi:hypothetical protein
MGHSYPSQIWLVRRLEYIFFFIRSSYTLIQVSRFSFILLIISQTDRTPWTSGWPVARPLPKHRTTQTQKKKTHTDTKHPCPEWDSNPRSRLSERAKTVHALDRSTTVTGRLASTMAISLRQGSGSAHLAQYSPNVRARPVCKHVLKTAAMFYRQSNTVCVLLLELLRLTKARVAIVYQHNQLQQKN